MLPLCRLHVHYSDTSFCILTANFRLVYETKTVYDASCMVQSIQSEERQVGHVNVNLDIDILVISKPKWLKFGLQAHFFEMFEYAKFQLSSFFTFRVMNLLVEVFSDFH